MTASDREIRGLIREHEAIRAQVRLFTNSLSRLSIKLASTSNQSDLKECLLGYRYALHDLRDGIRQHIDFDERIFRMLSIGTLVDSLEKEHEEIKRQIDRAVQIVSNALENETNQEKLKQGCSDINEVASTIKALVEAHTAKEDTLLTSVRRDS